MTVVQYKGVDASRLHSPAIWADCPIRAIQDGTVSGVYHFDDFISFGTFSANDDVPSDAPVPYFAGASTGVKIDQAGTDLGIISIEENDAAQDGSVLVYGNAAGFARFGPNDRVWMEARLGQSSVANSNPIFFFGAVEVNVAPTSVITLVDTTGLLDVSEDFVGFRTLPGAGATVEPIFQEGGDTLAHVGSGLAAAQGSGNDIPIAADTFYKLGFRWNGKRLSYYVDNQLVAHHTPGSGDAFPDANHLAMLWATKTIGAATTSFKNDWWACASLSVS